MYFDELKGGTFVPRSVLADLDSGCLDTIRSGHYKRLFKEDSFV